MERPDLSFPDGFAWGTATAAYQVEGAVDEDGRGPSIWDTFVRTPGKMLVDANADVACDHYHRFAEDVALMRDLGAKAYRFSISWPRIFPTGRGTPNPKGMDFYRRLVDALLDAGITPYATLYHWDLPQALQDEVGGWQSRETVDAFADYAAHVAAELGDRVGHYFTINEFSNVVDSGHGSGALAPGLRLPRAEVNRVRHHVVLAHGRAVQAIRAAAPAGTKVGPADNTTFVAPLVDTPDHVAAARRAMRELNAGYLTVMMEGRYTDGFLEREGADAPATTDEELATIGSPVDFVGLNVYLIRGLVRADEGPDGFELLPPATSHPHASAWHRISPESMYWGPRLVNDVWGPREILITENGCNSAGAGEGGELLDSDRVTLLRSYLAQLHRATAEGVPVTGYFHWSIMDNFEWIAGYANRYGLYHVDFDTQERRPKLSAQHYRELIARNSLV